MTFGDGACSEKHDDAECLRPKDHDGMHAGFKDGELIQWRSEAKQHCCVLEAPTMPGDQVITVGRVEAVVDAIDAYVAAKTAIILAQVDDEEVSWAKKKFLSDARLALRAKLLEWKGP